MGDGGPLKVLVVDDEDVVLTMMRRSLEKAGYEVMIAADGAEAVKVFRDSGASIAGVVLDMSMPVLGGEETLKALWELDPNLRVILSSGYSQDEAIEHIEADNEVAFIQKPFRPLELIRKAEEHFGAASGA